MRLREHDDDQRYRLPGSGDDPGSALPNLRQEADNLLAAGDEAINRALAGGDSEAFLRASRQQGGQ
jgi:hypothetical protein